MGVYKKGNRWFIDYYQPDGKRKREVVTIEGIDPSRITRQDALKALSIRKGQFAGGKFEIAQTKKAVLFDKFLAKYLDWAREHHKRPERDESAAKPLLSFFHGKPIHNINLWLIEKYKSKRKGENKKPETINKELALLRQMLNLALEWRDISTNPIKGIKLLKVPGRKYRVLSDEEFNKLYQASSPQLKPILLCAYLTGMRKGEIIKLRWKDVDFRKDCLYLEETKTDEPRTIPLVKELEIMLLEMKEKAKSDHVFTTPEGKPYTSETAWKTAWKNALKSSGIGKCRFHDLRHTFISNLLVEEKEDFATVMELSGHKDLRSLKRYTHSHEEAKKAAIQKLGSRIRKAGMDTYLDTKPQLGSPATARDESNYP